MDRIVIVSKSTQLQELIRQHQTEGAVRFALESKGQSFEKYQREHRVYQNALEEVRRQIPSDIQTASVTREELPNFLFREKDFIIVCGPDGLFVNLSQYVHNQLVLTVNPDPQSVSGELMLFMPRVVGKMIAQVIAGKHTVESLPFVKAVIDGEQIVWGINDLFIGRKDHISARYEISFSGKREYQSSSGIIVSTGVGSSGWMRSVVAMVNGLSQKQDTHKLLQLPDPEDEELVFVVREPYPSPNTGVGIVTGRIISSKPLVVISQIPEGGFIFSDGVIEKALEWNAGSTVEISVGDRFIQRIIP